MLDNKEVNEILEILENLEDEKLAVQLLAEFNSLTAKQGKLVLNLDKNISHDEWKESCDTISQEIKLLVEKIKNL